MIKSTEQQFAVAGTVYCAVQACSNFWVCGWDPKLGQYWAVLSVALFIMLYKGVLSFESVMKSWSVTIQVKATEQYFLVVLFIVLRNVVLTFESVDEILNCDPSNESYWAVL